MANAILSPEFVDAFQSLKSGDSSAMDSFVNGLSNFGKGFGNLIGGLTGFTSAKMVDDTNRYIAEQNLEFQKEVQEYNKALQEKIFEREDNSVQRRALDLEKAGLSPTLAAGSSANAGQVVALSPRHNDYQPSNLMSGSLQVLQAMTDILNSQRQTSSEAVLNRAAARKANAEAEQTEFETSVDKVYSEAERDAQLSKLIADTTYITDYQFAKAEADIKKLESDTDLNKAKISQVFKDMNLTDKQIELIEYQFKDLDASTALKKAQKILYDIQADSAKVDFQNQLWNRDYYKHFGMPVSSSGAPIVDKFGLGLGYFPGHFSFDATSSRSFDPTKKPFKFDKLLEDIFGFGPYKDSKVNARGGGRAW